MKPITAHKKCTPAVAHTMQRALLAGLLACAALLPGCASLPSVVHTQVTSYNHWEVLPAEKTYTFARTLQWQTSAEMQAYEDMLRDELQLQGFKEVRDGGAKLSVTLRPEVTTFAVKVAEPVFYGYGPYWWPRHPRYWAYNPIWREDSVNFYRHSLTLEIDEAGSAGKHVYQGTVQIDSAANVLRETMPYMIRALFSDFPGNNGQTRKVDVPEK